MQYCVDGITVEIIKPKTKSSHDEDVKRVAMFIYTLGQIQKEESSRKKENKKWTVRKKLKKL